MKITTNDPTALARRAFFLAYEASSSVGILQAVHGMTEEQVFDYVFRPDADRCDADYVAGRMMKLRVIIDPDGVVVPDHACFPDYQSWCSTYPTFEALFEAAAQELAA